MPSTQSLQDIQRSRQLIAVPGKNGVEKEDVVIGYRPQLQMEISTQSLSNADIKAREFNLNCLCSRERLKVPWQMAKQDR